MSASTELLKRAAFLDELYNRLYLLTADQLEKEDLVVMDYLDARIKEIDAKTSN